MRAWGRKFVCGGWWCCGWLTPTTYIQLAGAGSKTHNSPYIFFHNILYCNTLPTHNTFFSREVLKQIIKYLENKYQFTWVVCTYTTIQTYYTRAFVFILKRFYNYIQTPINFLIVFRQYLQQINYKVDNLWATLIVQMCTQKEIVKEQ